MSSLKIQTGDILRIKQGIILHQVNCIGATGGLAGAIRRVHPNAFPDYWKMVSLHRKNAASLLGNFAVGRSGQVAIGHIFGQIRPGPFTDLKAAAAGLAGLAQFLRGQPDLANQPVFAPFKMGCGRGEADWEAYLAEIDRHFPSATVLRHPYFAS